MNVHKRLFGTLRNRSPDHDPLKGSALEVPKGSTVGNLIEQLGINETFFKG